MVSISTTAIIMIMIISIIIIIIIMIQALGTITMHKGTWSRSTGHWRQYNEDFHSDFGPYPLSLRGTTVIKLIIIHSHKHQNASETLPKSMSLLTTSFPRKRGFIVSA